MTAQSIIDRVRQIVQQRTPSNSIKSDPAILGDINECTRVLCSMLTSIPKEEITGVVAASTIILDRDVLRLDYAAIVDGTDYYLLDTIDFPNFVRLNPNWQNTAEGKPNTLIRMTDLEWRMYPTPDSDWLGKSLSLFGSVTPADLTSTSEEPPVSRTLHHAYPHYCSWLFFLALNNPERAAAEYAIFDSIRKTNTKTATATKGSLSAIRWR